MDHWIAKVALGATMLTILAGCSHHQSKSSDQPMSAIDQCWQQVSARSELASCLQQVLSDVGQQASVAEQKTAQQADLLDGMSTPKIEAHKSFEQAKSSFHQFRERFCRWQETMSAAGGSGAGDGYRACYVETTRWWAKLLNDQLQSQPE